MSCSPSTHLHFCAKNCKWPCTFLLLEQRGALHEFCKAKGVAVPQFTHDHSPANDAACTAKRAAFVASLTWEKQQ